MHSFKVIIYLVICSFITTANGSDDEHLPLGTNYVSNRYVTLNRNAYTVFFDTKNRIPALVSYHIEPDYRKTAKRKSRFKKFRSDPNLNKPVVNKDYTHSGFARGHMAPYFISGGDRDHDGHYASLRGPSDEDDEKTIYEINYMSNITPQHHRCFNGAGAVWYGLESYVRNTIDKTKQEAWVYAGVILNDSHNKIGPNSDIAIPDKYYKIILQKREDGHLNVLAFLFPHYQMIEGECNDDDKKFNHQSHFVSINEIENLTGIDFFKELPDFIEEDIESVNTFLNWNR